MMKLYKLIDINTGEELLFPCQYSISRYLGKSKSWTHYIIKYKDGKYKNYMIQEVESK